MIEQADFDAPEVWYKIGLALFVVALFILSITIASIRDTMSAATLQTSSQKQQSKAASIAIISYMAIYVPLTGLDVYMYQITQRHFMLLNGFLNIYLFCCMLRFQLYCSWDWNLFGKLFVSYVVDVIKPGVRKMYLYL